MNTASPHFRPTSSVSEARRPRRRRSTAAARRPRYAREVVAETSLLEEVLESGGDLLVGGLSAATTYVLSDMVDRYIATVDPSATGPAPADKFVSSGSGTLGNTLNVASPPSAARVGVAVAVTALPALAAMAVEDDGVGRAALEGAAIGGGVKLVSLIWSNLVMPMLVGKDTSAPALQKSYVARLFPAEVAASLNLKQTPVQHQVSSSGSGALSGPPQLGMGAPDVGPFALSGDSPYPTAEAALRQHIAGMVSGDSPYPTAEAALRRGAGVGGDSPYPSAHDALRREAGVSQPPSYTPGPASTPGPGPQVHEHDDSCGCGVGGVSDAYGGYGGFLGAAEENGSVPPLWSVDRVASAVVRAGGARSN